MLAFTQGLSKWARQLQQHAVDGFGNLQPMEYFAIAIVALIVGYFLLVSPR